jgi:hypothetical protein
VAGKANGGKARSPRVGGRVVPVRMLVSTASMFAALDVGEIVEVPADTAKAWIASGQAEPVKRGGVTAADARETRG